MNRRLCIGWLTAFFVVWSTITLAQTTTTLTGIVADAVTGKPMPFANVYLNSSTRGTLTNGEGQYSLPAVRLGTVEVVASFVGYQPQRQRLRLYNTEPKRTNFRLTPTDQTLATVVVRGNMKRWQRHLQQFKRQLFGDPFGGQCEILNPDVLSFKEERGHLTATATEPLAFVNHALGYKLWYDLLHFDGTSQKVYYAGTARFEETTPKDNKEEKKFQRNRIIAYRGSVRHLMATLVDSTYEREGFMVYQENMVRPIARTKDNRTTLYGSVNRRLLPLPIKRMILPGQLPHERRLVSSLPLVVFYTGAVSNYSPYSDAHYAYSQFRLPTNQIQFTVDGTITMPEGMEIQGTLADDRLSTMLPADWQPTKTEDGLITGAPVALVGKLKWPDDRLVRITTKFTDVFKDLAPVVFVHTDKPFYTTGDTVWLSAYLLDAATNRRQIGETAMHIDLLTPSGKSVQHQWLYVTDGRATASLRLSDSLRTGTYRLRAYTDEDDGQHRPAFERNIAVYNLLRPVPDAPADSAEKPLDVQLLPEGGHWVPGVPAKIGIKVLTPDGQGVAVSGRIITNTGGVVAAFQTTPFGIGSVSLTATAETNYYAEINHNGQRQPVPLPPVDAEGMTLAIDALSDTTRLLLTINDKSRISTDSVYVLIQQQGRLVEQYKILLQDRMAQVSLPLAALPAGINQVTLFDVSSRPRAERLVFAPMQFEPVRVVMDLNKTRFKPRERASLSINLNDEGQPAVGILSASITDADQVPDDTAAATFQTHLLLTGELSGRVEHPNFYLKDNAPETRRALDDLLLTQGWRRVSGTPDTELLGGVSLMGRVLNAKNQPIANAQFIVASTAREQSYVRSAGTNERGRFRLAGLVVADTIQLMTQLADHQLKDLPAKEAHYVLEGPGASWQPDSASYPIRWADFRAQLDAARIRQEADAERYRDKTVKLLKEVIVRARKPDDRPGDIQRSSLHNGADATLLFDEKSPRFANLYEMIRGRLSGVSVTQLTDLTKSVNGGYQVIIRGVGTLKSSPQALFLVDGMPIQDPDGTALLSFSPGDIERVEVLKNAGTAGIYGIRGGNGVIAFYTRRFRPDKPKNEEKKGMIPLQVIGYSSVQREFYIPRYEAESTEQSIANTRIDRRDVLYWKPIIQTDSQGHTQLLFPLSDVVKRVRVTVQGITNEGRPVVGVATIQVQ